MDYSSLLKSESLSDKASATFPLTNSEKIAFDELLSLRARENILLIGSKRLSDLLSVSRARAYHILSGLQKKELLEKLDRKGFYPTKIGLQLLDLFEHNIQVLEVYFQLTLDLDPKKAEVEARNLVLYVSQSFIDLICKKIGKPTECVHGRKITHVEDTKR